MIHCGVSENTTCHGKYIGRKWAVLVPDRFVTNAITLDGQTFVDDDGSVYLYWGGIDKGFSLGAENWLPYEEFTETRLIPNTETRIFRSALWMKRNRDLLFMYSSGSCHVYSPPIGHMPLRTKPMGTVHLSGMYS